MIYRFIDFTGREQTLNDLTELIRAVQNRQLSGSSLVFDGESGRWKKALDIEAISPYVVPQSSSLNIDLDQPQHSSENSEELADSNLAFREDEDTDLNSGARTGITNRQIANQETSPVSVTHEGKWALRLLLVIVPTLMFVSFAVIVSLPSHVPVSPTSTNNAVKEAGTASTESEIPKENLSDAQIGEAKRAFDAYDGRLLTALRLCDGAYFAMTKVEEKPTPALFGKISELARTASEVCTSAGTNISSNLIKQVPETIPTDVREVLGKAAEGAERVTNQRKIITSLTVQMLADTHNSELSDSLKTAVEAHDPLVFQSAAALAEARAKMEAYTRKLTAAAVGASSSEKRELPAKGQVVVTESMGCLSIDGWTEYFRRYDEFADKRVSLPGGCVELNVGTRVSNSFQKVPKAGSKIVIYVLVDVPGQGRLWTMDGHLDDVK